MPVSQQDPTKPDRPFSRYLARLPNNDAVRLNGACRAALNLQHLRRFETSQQVDPAASLRPATKWRLLPGAFRELRPIVYRVSSTVGLASDAEWRVYVHCVDMRINMRYSIRVQSLQRTRIKGMFDHSYTERMTMGKVVCVQRAGR